MSLSHFLASVCVGHQKRADGELNLDDVRERFEYLTSQEESSREHADRLKELARARELREDVSPTGHLVTGYKRLMPIPYTMGEAAIRAPITLGGGYLGYQLGKRYEAPDPTEVKKLFAPAEGLVSVSGKAGKGMSIKASPLVGALIRIREGTGYKRKTQAAKSVRGRKLLAEMSLLKPEELSGLLRERQIFPFGMSAEQQRVHGRMEKFLGEKGMAKLPGEVRNLLEQASKDKGTLESVLAKLRPWRLAGGALGMGAAGALSGLPYAARALYLKRQGGEAAARAKAKMEQALAEAESAAARRESLLGQMERKEPMVDVEGAP